MSSGEQHNVTDENAPADADARRDSRRHMMRLALAGTPMVLTLKSRPAQAIVAVSCGSCSSTQPLQDGGGGGGGGGTGQ